MQLDEALLDHLASALRAALTEVELTDEQRQQLGESMRRHLAGLDGVNWRTGNGLPALPAVIAE